MDSYYPLLLIEQNVWRSYCVLEITKVDEGLHTLEIFLERS